MKASIIIVSFNNGPELFDCINSCLNSASCGEIIIVNNGNGVDFYDDLVGFASQRPQIHLFDSKTNIGFGAACNSGAKNAKFDALAFLNPDAVLKSGALDKILQTLGANEKAIIGGLLLDENGKEQTGPRRGELNIVSALLSFSKIAKPMPKGGFLRDFNQNREPLPVDTKEVQTISGAFFAIRKSDFLSINGFDERYFIHVEDIDICKRHRNSGGKVFFEPRAIAIHIGGASDVPKLFVAKHKFKSFMRYFWTHSGVFGKIAAIVSAPLLWISIVGRAIARDRHK